MTGETDPSRNPSERDEPQPERPDASALEREPLADDDADALRTVSLDQALARPRTRRRRTLQAAGALLALLLVGVVFARALPSSGLPLVAPAPSATPTGPLVGVVSNVAAQGVTLRVNGRRVAGTLPQVVRLRQGATTLTVSAPPFQDRTCVVVAPDPIRVYPGATACLIMSRSNDFVDGSFGGAFVAYEVLIHFSALDLPINQSDQVDTVVAGALAGVTGQAQVQAGDYISVGDGTLAVPGEGASRLPAAQRAPHPLSATLSLAPNLQPPLALGYGQSVCLTATRATNLCAVTPSDHIRDAAHDIIWSLTTPVTLIWRFTDPATGATQLSHIASPDMATLTLGYSATSGWYAVSRLSLHADTPYLACDVGRDTLVVSRQLTGSSATPSPLQSGASLARPSPDALGCALHVEDDRTPAGGATFVYRFGALLAVDANAQAVLPGAPLAPQDELLELAG